MSAHLRIHDDDPLHHPLLVFGGLANAPKYSFEVDGVAEKHRVNQLLPRTSDSRQITSAEPSHRP
jgi:hypothetical protein